MAFLAVRAAPVACSPVALAMLLAPDDEDIPSLLMVPLFIEPFMLPLLAGPFTTVLEPAMPPVPTVALVPAEEGGVGLPGEGLPEVEV